MLYKDDKAHGKEQSRQGKSYTKYAGIVNDRALYGKGDKQDIDAYKIAYKRLCVIFGKAAKGCDIVRLSVRHIYGVRNEFEGSFALTGYIQYNGSNTWVRFTELDDQISIEQPILAAAAKMNGWVMSTRPTPKGTLEKIYHFSRGAGDSSSEYTLHSHTSTTLERRRKTEIFNQLAQMGANERQN